MTTLKLSKGQYDQALIDHFEFLRKRFLNRCFSSPALQIGTTSKKAVRINATTVFIKDGVFKSKSAAEPTFTATTHDIAASSTNVREAVYLLTIDGSGNVTFTKGEEATGAGNAKLPELPSDSAVVLGHVRVAVAAGSTKFDATSDDLDAAHLTVTYVSGDVMPSFESEQ